MRTPGELRKEAAAKRRLADELAVPYGISVRSSLAAQAFRQVADELEKEADRAEKDLMAGGMS